MGCTTGADRQAGHLLLGWNASSYLDAHIQQIGDIGEHAGLLSSKAEGGHYAGGSWVVQTPASRSPRSLCGNGSA